jgi:hypothetical protein
MLSLLVERPTDTVNWGQEGVVMCAWMTHMLFELCNCHVTSFLNNFIKVTGFAVGDRVAYLASHSYAEYVTVNSGMCFCILPRWGYSTMILSRYLDTTVKLPDNVSLEDGAAILLQGWISS